MPLPAHDQLPNLSDARPAPDAAGQPPGAFSRRALVLGAAGGLLATGLAGCRTQGSGPAAGSTTLPLPKTIAREIPGVIKPADPSGTLGMERYPAPYKSVKAVPGKGGVLTTQRILYGSPPEMGSGTNPLLEQLNEMSGVDWQVTNIPAAAFNDKITTMIAGGDYPELFWSEPTWRAKTMQKYFRQGAFWNMRELLQGDTIDAYPNIAATAQQVWRNSSFSGINPVVPGPRSIVPVGVGFFRADYADKAGVTAPEKGEDLLDFLTELQGAGPKGTYAVATTSGAIIWLGLHTHQVATTWRLDEASGKLTHQLETEEYAAGLEYALSLYEAGLVHPDATTLDTQPTQQSEMFVRGQAAWVTTATGNIVGGEGSGIDQMNKRGEGGRLGWMLPPGFGGQPGAVLADQGWWGGYGIPKTVTDENRIAELLGLIDFLSAPPGSEEWATISLGKRGWNYELDADNQPVIMSDQLSPEEQNFGFALPMSLPPAVFNFGTKWTSSVRTQMEIEAAAMPLLRFEPTLGYASETQTQKGDALTQMITDFANQVMSGRRKLTDLPGMITEWKSQGGDAMRAEYEKAIAEDPTR